MGILDNIVGSLLGGSNNQSGTQAGMGGAGLGGVLSGLLAGGQSGGGAGAGGLGGLISQFEQAGLGNIAQSWIGNGANQPVSPSQLQNVFGDKISGWAQQAGMNQGDFLSQLSQHLPGAVDQATPNGQAQNDGSMNV